MANYGRNFEFRVSPKSGQRSGRHYFGGATAIAIGAAVSVDPTTVNVLGMSEATIATEGATNPVPGIDGIGVFEYGPAGYAGDDASLVLYSDKSVIPVVGTQPGSGNSGVQVVSGTTVKVVLRNTVDSTFLNSRDYTGRVMVAGVSIATPTLIAGDFLIPGAGDDTDGYWKEGGDADTAWMVVTKVDLVRDEVEARLLF